MDFERLSRSWTALRASIDWLPDLAVAAIMVVLAILVTLGIHAALVLALRRLGRGRPFLDRIVAATRGLFRFALIVLALALVLPAAPLNPQLSAIASHVLQLAFVALIGAMALAATDIAATLYLLRYRLDTEDNLLARKHVTQVRVLKGAVNTLIIVLTIGAGLMTFEHVRQYGVSLLASAGAAGIVVGLAARPLFTNLFAGIQLAMAQPIRIEDAVVVENEFGFVEEITATYVVVRIWDQRRMVVPLSYFLEKPFQNWTREGTALLGPVMVYVDYSAPVERIRAKLMEIVDACPQWDRRVANLQVNDLRERTMELRCLVSAASAGALGELRAEVRERLVAFLQRECPTALPRTRADIRIAGDSDGETRRSTPAAEA